MTTTTTTPTPTGRSALGQDALAHVDALYNHARHLAGNTADADELVQETYTRALAGAHTFLGGNLKAWLFTILRSAFMDSHRRGRRQPAPGELDDGPLDGLQMEGGIESSFLRDDLDGAGLRSLVGAEIEAALSSLSDHARTVVLLDVEGFTESEIAAVLGCPLGTVKSRLSRARVLLRERLKDYAPRAPRQGNTRMEDR